MDDMGLFVAGYYAGKKKGGGSADFNQFDYIAGLPSVFEMEISDGWKFDIVTESQGKLTGKEVVMTSASQDTSSCVVSVCENPFQMYSRWYLNGDIKFIYKLSELPRPLHGTAVYEYDIPENGPMGSPSRVDVLNSLTYELSIVSRGPSYSFSPAIIKINLKSERRKINLKNGESEVYSVNYGKVVDSGEIIFKSGNFDSGVYSNMVYATWHYAEGGA